MSDFEPTTDFPESADDDNLAVPSDAKARDERVQARRRTAVRAVSVATAVSLTAFGFDPLRVLIAVGVGYILLAVGVRILGAFARPIPEAPPQGELRRVKLTYRCAICGTELRMTLANDTVPAPPRHCADEMELTTNLEDIL